MALGDFSVGSTGQGVRDLQTYLRGVGYPVTVDGVYGPETRSAVRAFQTARSIRVDGVAGPETLVALAQARSEGWKATVAAVPTAPSHTPGAPVTTAATAQIPGLSKIPEKYRSLALMLGIIVAVWWLAGDAAPARSRGSSFKIADPDGGEPEEEEDEPEEEEEGGDE